MEIYRDFTKLLEERLRENLNFIQVVLGPRQVGKSTGMEQIVNRWKGPSHMASADGIAPPRADWIELNWNIARAKGPGTLLVLDEVQKVKGWSAAIKSLFDPIRKERSLKVVLLGSASLALHEGLADSLAGRYEIIRADHWSYSECREAFDWDLNTYLKFGGYPAAAELIGDIRRWQSFLRDSIIEPVLMKDLLAFESIHKPALFRQTFLLALEYPAMEISLQKLLGQLQDSGNVTTIKHYLEIFEGAYLLRTLQKYSGSRVRRKGSSPKILPLNTALIHAYRNPLDVDEKPDWRGRVFETAIGAELSRRSDALFYWREGREEVDFIVEIEGRLYAVEVKSSVSRSRSGLSGFCQKHKRVVPVIMDTKKGEALLSGTPLPDLV